MGRKEQLRRGTQQTKHRHSHNLDQSNKLQTSIDDLLKLTSQPSQQNVMKEFETAKELLVLIDDIVNLEKCVDENYSVGNDARCNSATLDGFVTWLKSNGAKLDGVTISSYSEFDLGLQADVNIGETSLMIAVPRKLMLTLDVAKQSLLAPLISKDAILQNMPNVCLALFLLFEKFKDGSFWKPYLDILPRSYATVLSFNIDELSALIASPTLKPALSQIKSIARQYAYFYKFIRLVDDPACKILRKRFTYKEYR